MPTTLPVRAARPCPSPGVADFVATMAAFYAATALYVVLVVAIEYRFGMFTGLTLLESIARELGTGIPYSDPQLVGLF